MTATTWRILSYSLWQRRFGGDPGVVGRTVVMDGRPGTVVGIMPPGFGFPAATRHTELWVPLGIVSRASTAGA